LSRERGVGRHSENLPGAFSGRNGCADAYLPGLRR
jgi:hypothetical protein